MIERDQLKVGRIYAKYRPCEVSWITDIADQCRAHGVPCYVKQDAAKKSGQQGRIPNAYWEVKEFPQ
jgi:protein gp37